MHIENEPLINCATYMLKKSYAIYYVVASFVLMALSMHSLFPFISITPDTPFIPEVNSLMLNQVKKTHHLIEITSNEQLLSQVQFSESSAYNNTDMGFSIKHPSEAQIEEEDGSVFFRLPDGLVSILIDRNIQDKNLRDYTNSILGIISQSYNEFELEGIGNYTLSAGYPSDYVMFSFNGGVDDGLAFTTVTGPSSNVTGYILLFTTSLENSDNFQQRVVEPMESTFEITQNQSIQQEAEDEDEDEDDDATDQDDQTPSEEEDEEPIIRF